MSTMTIHLPEMLYNRVENFAEQEGMSINQFIVSAVTDKIASLLKMKFWSRNASDGTQTDNQTELAEVMSDGQTETVANLSDQEQLNRAIQSMMVDKTLLKENMSKFLSSQSIQGEPIGVEALREQMRAANLGPNELSQGIIMARDE